MSDRHSCVKEGVFWGIPSHRYGTNVGGKKRKKKKIKEKVRIDVHEKMKRSEEFAVVRAFVEVPATR